MIIDEPNKSRFVRSKMIPLWRHMVMQVTAVSVFIALVVMGQFLPYNMIGSNNIYHRHEGVSGFFSALVGMGFCSEDERNTNYSRSANTGMNQVPEENKEENHQKKDRQSEYEAKEALRKLGAFVSIYPSAAFTKDSRIYSSIYGDVQTPPPKFFIS